MRVDIRRFGIVVTGCVSGPVVALAMAAAAAAEPPNPVVPPAPAPAPAPGPAPAAQAAAGDPGALPAADASGIPHLASPDALPPGATMDPTGQGTETPNLSYLKDLWHAVQNQEISGKEALVLGLAQRGMNTPVPGQVPGPNVPTAPQAPGEAPVSAGPGAPLQSVGPGGAVAPAGPGVPVPVAGPAGPVPAPPAPLP
ncbi:hypothetical protein ACP6C7_21630 [Mycolicibacterium septicum]|jgi:hypothetical protein|uniref:Uncharacterized protein n=1 Tax=Mycolicibacterium septicum TaxID=98668 RepID=A0ABW9LSN2_9MYCO